MISSSRSKGAVCFRALLCIPLLAGLAFAPAAFGQSLSKVYFPGTIGPGSTTTLTYTLNNDSGIGLRGAGFTDTLPAGTTVAAPSAIRATCFGAVSAPSGGSTITFSNGEIPASTSCTISVNVKSSAVGSYSHTSSDLTWGANSAAGASATLTVGADRPGFTKSFSPSSVRLGGRARLVFTIDNSANSVGMFNLRFSDTLPTNMVVASPANALRTCTGGAVTAAAGSTTISYAPALGGFDASVAAGAVCTVSVDVQVNAVGTLGNTSGDLISVPQSGGFTTKSSGYASATLTSTIEQIAISKSFIDDPVAPGDEVEVEYTIRNLDRRNSASSITFSDDLDAALTGLTATGLPSSPCGAGSSLSGSSTLVLSGGSLGIEGVCTFRATLQVPSNALPGIYTSTTSNISGDFRGSTAIGDPASDDLFVQPVPVLEATFLESPIGGGSSVTLQYTLSNSSTTDSATDISFSNEFPTIFRTASATPGNEFCGSGSTSFFRPWSDNGFVNPASLTITGASLAPGASCTFSITLDTDASSPSNFYTTTTSEVSATVDGDAVEGKPASATVQVVNGPVILKEFVDDPVRPGDAVTLRFTLSLDESAPGPATDITFTDDLDATLSGLVASSLPTEPCGPGSAISGSMTLLLTGGSLGVGETCVFDVALQTPLTAAPGAYTNTTSNVVSTVLGVSTVGNAASDDLRIAGLDVVKEFTNDPVLPGSTVNLRFTLTNNSSTDSATSVQIQDDLGDTVTGLQISTTPTGEPCGSGSSLLVIGGDRLILQGGNLAPGASCTFEVGVLVPASVEPDEYPSSTLLISAIYDNSLVIFENVTDFLVIETTFLDLSKEFLDDPVGPGDAVTLRFTIVNLSPDEAVTSITFSDDLDAALSGLSADGSVLADVCGAGSQLSGTSLLSFTGGSLAAGGSCSFDVALTVPNTVPLDAEVVNVTSIITGLLNDLPVDGNVATDVLEIESIAFSKAFSASVEAGDTVELVFSLENLAGGSINLLSFTDDLDAVLPGLTAIGLPATDVCGEGSVIDGSSLLTFQNGNLLPGGSCTFSVTLQVPASAAVGDYLNETSSLSRAGEIVATPATATLTIFEVVIVDSDGDGVLDGDDLCPGTVIPESVPTRGLKKNRYALVDGDTIFDSLPGGTGDVFTTTDTAGCSCEQIIEAQELGEGHAFFGCSVGEMRSWVELVKQPFAGGYIGRAYRVSRN